MSLAENRLSSEPIVANYIGDANLPKGRNFEYISGGYSLQDPSQGLTGQVWLGSIVDGSILTLSAANYPEQPFYTGVNITDLSIAFDRNMNLNATFIEDGEFKLYWYDSTVGEMVVSSFGNDCKTPRVNLDDKREFNSINSDIILAYIKDGNLYYRQQRDRFTIEYLLKNGNFLAIEKIGMNAKNRMQFSVLGEEK